MKKDIHPQEYRTVVMQDTSNGDSFLTRSTAETDETIKWEDGNEYPLVKIHISSTSHPFYTGKEKLVDIEGRVDKFKARQVAAEKMREKLQTKSKKAPKKSNKPEVKPMKIGEKSTGRSEEVADTNQPADKDKVEATAKESEKVAVES